MKKLGVVVISLLILLLAGRGLLNLPAVQDILLKRGTAVIAQQAALPLE